VRTIDAVPDPVPDIDAVTRLIEQVANEIVLPKFRALRDDEIHHKPTEGHSNDLVTVVDRAAEARLTSGLLEIVPSAHVIGEEAAHHNPGLVALLDDDAPVWIVDPLDGTSNFAGGIEAFGIMVGYALRGKVKAAWIHLPARGEFFVAEAGGGAYRNGERLRVPPAIPENRPRGTFFVRYMPPALRRAVTERVSAGGFVNVAQTGAAAVEYTDVLLGRKEFAVYYRLLPWDHAGPALILTEGGGAVEHLNGDAYTVRSKSQLTLVARDAEMASRLRAWLGPEMNDDVRADRSMRS
jgi:fructose-1,6-bisphosphatase/inositol monophosphatase family enzyme